MHLYPVDGAAAGVGADETAWGWRDARFSQVMVGISHDPGHDGELRDWAISLSEAMAPYGLGAAYGNFMQDEGQEKAARSYGASYPRLQRVKAQYDPGNVFHVNQNIVPAG